MPAKAAAVELNLAAHVATVFRLLDKIERDTTELMTALDDLRKRIKETSDA